MAHAVKRIQVKPASAVTREPRHQGDAADPLTREAVRSLLDKNLKSFGGFNLDRDQPFSWTRCLISIVGYILLVSDIVRTGPGIRQEPTNLLRIEPNVLVFVGPVGYLTNHLTLTNATAARSGRLWPYKYDTTSIAMRAFAQHWELGSSWPPCVFYRERCQDPQSLPLWSVFNMVDSLVEAAGSQPPLPSNKLHVSSSRGAVSLRINSKFRDRLHHYVLPWWFEQTVKRTIQAAHFRWFPESTAASICSPWSASRPYTCDQSWTRHLKVSCTLSGTSCAPQKRVWAQIPARMRFIAQTYPNHSIEFAVLDGTDDYSRGGLTYQGRRRQEVVVLSRIRSCDAHHICTTVAVDDYRFETLGFVMNASGWYTVVGSLRVAAQLYTWLRLALLVGVCHAARSRASDPYQRASFSRRARTLARTIFLIPSQVVIYGSLFPIVLYFLAHSMDSPAVYALVSMRFNSLFGSFTWNVSDFVNHCAVAMRSGWVLSVLCHLAFAVFAESSWSPMRGIRGVPELFISGVASVTLFAEYRALVLRDTRVLEIVEIVPSARLHQLRSNAHNASPTAITSLFFGSTVDYKCLLHALLALLLVSTVCWVVNRAMPKHAPVQVTLVSRTLVPYSAGWLWPANRLVVSWFGSLVSVSAPDATAHVSFQRRSGPQRFEGVVFPSYGKTRRQLPRYILNLPDRGLVVRNTEATRQVWREMETIDRRSREIESTIYLINLAVMTDPVTLLRLRYFSHCRVGLYQSKVTRRCFLLPFGLKTSNSDVAIDWDELVLLVVVNTQDLEWDELLRCG